MLFFAPQVVILLPLPRAPTLPGLAGMMVSIYPLFFVFFLVPVLLRVKKYSIIPLHFLTVNLSLLGPRRPPVLRRQSAVAVPLYSTQICAVDYLLFIIYLLFKIVCAH